MFRTSVKCGAILFLVWVLVSNVKSVAQTHEPYWIFRFDADFNSLYLSTGKLSGTYSVLFNEEFADNLTVPIGRYWSPSKIYRNFGFDFLSEEPQGGDLHFFRSFETLVEDELNLTMFPSWYPWDHYVTGFIVALNVTMEFKAVLVKIDLSPDVESLWRVSYSFEKMDVDFLRSPFSDISSKELETVKSWNNVSMYSFTLSFRRREPMATRLALTSWLPAVATLTMSIFFWVVYINRRKAYPAILIGVASFQAAFIGIFLNTGPPSIPNVLGLLIGGIVFSLFSVAAMYYLEARKPGVGEKIDELRSFIGEMKLESISSKEVPTTFEEIGVDEGDKVSILDHETGRKVSGTVLDTHLFIKVSYAHEKEGFFKDQMLIKLHEPLPGGPMILQDEKGFPIGVVWAASKTHAIAAKIPSERIKD